MYLKVWIIFFNFLAIVNAAISCGYTYHSYAGYCEDGQYCCEDNTACCNYTADLSLGAIIGILGGCIAGLSVLSTIICVCKVRNKKKINPMLQGGLPQGNQRGQQIGMHQQSIGQQPQCYGMQQSFVGQTPLPQQPQKPCGLTKAQEQQNVASFEELGHEEPTSSQGGSYIVFTNT